MNKGLLTSFLSLLFSIATIYAQNPQGDLRIQMFDYYNLVVDHNIQTPAGASPRSVYLGIKVCNDGSDAMSDVFAYIGDYNEGTPGLYPTTTPSGMPYSGTFSFTHEGGSKDATRYIGDLAAGECVTQYWLASYPLLDANGNRVTGSKPDQTDDLMLSYDVWASANDNGTMLEANDSKTVQLRAEISAMANKIWPNTTSKVPNEFLAAFPDKQLGWRQTTAATHPGASVVLEGIWFDLGKIEKGFDNDGDFTPDFNFLLQPVGNPATFDANCFRLVKMWGMIVVKLTGNQTMTFEFEDQMHFKGIPGNNTGAVGMVFYEFAVLDGPCNAQLSPYQEVASGSNNEKHNGDFGSPGGMLTSVAPDVEFTVTGPSNALPGDQVEMQIELRNTTDIPLGLPRVAAPVVIEQDIVDGNIYVSGSAEDNNTLPPGTTVTVLYSTDGGVTWDRTEPTPATAVKNIQWWFGRSFQPGETATVTYDVIIPPSYQEPILTTEARVSTGGSVPFMRRSANVILNGTYTIADRVFADNGAGEAILGDGVQSGAEPGIPNVAVRLYNDLNQNGQQDNGDILIAEVLTNLTGDFSFTELSNANYLVVVDPESSVFAPGWTNTTPVQFVANDIANTTTSVKFGFAPLLRVSNQLVGDTVVFESDLVQYQVGLTNMSYAEDNDNSSTVMAWASQLAPTNEFNNNPNNLLGPPDSDLSWPSSWTSAAAVKGFDFGAQEGEIEKVELIFSVCLDYPVNNDYLTISFTKENGATVVVPDPGLSKISSPSLNDYVGPPGLGFIVLDITDYQQWNWGVFDADWTVTMDGIKVQQADGAIQYTDAIGVRVTTSCCASTSGEPGNPYATITQLPLTYQYDDSKLEFVSASRQPDQVVDGAIIYDNLAPLYPNQTQDVTLTFEARQPINGLNGDPITTTAIVVDASNGNAVTFSQISTSPVATLLNKGSIAGSVFGDKDGDGWVGVFGYENGTDYFVPGATVNLYGCVNSAGDLIYPAPNTNRTCTHSANGGQWALIGTDVTDENGKYLISGVDNGYYYLAVNESSITGIVSRNADPDQTLGLSSGDSQWKTPNAKLKDVGVIGIGNDHSNINFGYRLDEVVTGTIWEDLDGDGVQEQGENPMAGVPVMLVHSGCTQGVNCPTVATNAQGRYTFATINPNVSYTIKVDTSAAPGSTYWLVTYEQDGTANNAITKTLATNEQSYSNDFGLRPNGLSDLGGNVYYDWHGNAHINNSDEGIEGVTLQLFRDLNGDGIIQATDPSVGITSTDILGNYRFPNLPSGNYIIKLDENTLSIFPKQTEDVDEIGICTVCDAQVRLNGVDGTTDNLTIDFGYELTGEGTASGSVYYDYNGNGFVNGGDEGLQNIEVRIEADLNQDGNFVWIRTSTTDASGVFGFDQLPDGLYRIAVNPADSDIPIDHTGTLAMLTTPGSFQLTIANKIVVAVDGTTCAGACDTELPAFGFADPGIIVSFVFFDENGNGTQDFNEPGIPNARLYLCNTDDGYCDATNAIDSVMTSNGSSFEPVGFYRFDGLRAGEYTVTVDESSLPLGAELTSDPSADGLPCYSPLDPADPYYNFLLQNCDGKIDNVSISLGSQNTGPSFGYQPRGVIGDVVWFDDNENGVMDSNEPGMFDVLVTVRNLNTVVRDGITFEPGEYTRSTYTDVDGTYSFSELPDGIWELLIAPPVDYVATFDADGTPDNTTQLVIADGDVTNVGNTWCPANSNCSMNLVFGIRPSYTNSVSGFVCLDADEDGTCNTGGETFPTGTDLFIHDIRGTFFGQTTVDPSGAFLFERLPTDTFVISVVKTSAPLRLTSLTTSLGDTPAYELEDQEDNAIQKVAISGIVTDMHFGFTFSDTFDLGDLPLPFLTRVDGAASGPAHLLSPTPTLYLGSSVDAENAPTLNALANGDDTSGNDDEDGITFSNASTWVATPTGGSFTAVVNGNGYLLGFADFNYDGDFNDAGELIINRSITTGTHNITFGIPASTVLTGGQDIYFRFRLFENAPFSPSTAHSGIVVNGEVEDYLVSICKILNNAGTIVGAQTGCDGYDAEPITAGLAPEGGGGDIEYQWQQSTNGGVTWIDIAGANEVTYDPGVLSQTTRYRRAARRSRCANFIFSNSVIKTVVTNYTDPGIIVGNEENCGIYDPDLITNVVAPSGGSGTTSPFYQWQQSTDGGTTWADIVNANSEYLDPGVISQTTLYRRGARKTPCATYLYSSPITKVVSVNYVNAGSIAGNQSICGSYDPTPITSTALPSGGTDGYDVMQWQRSTNGGASWTNITGAFAATYDPGVISQTTLYRRQARRVPCSVWVNSNVVTKTVKPFPAASIVTFPVSGSGYLCELTNYEFKAAAAPAGTVYDWNFGTYGIPGTAAGIGSHYAQFNVPDGPVLTGTSISLTTTLNGCVATDNKSLTFRPEIKVDSVVTQDPSQCQSKNGRIWVHATFPASSTIQYSVDGGISWQTNYEFTNLGAGVYDIRVRYMGGDCQEIHGNVALSDPPPQSILLVSSSEECVGETIVVEAIPIGSNPVFTWSFGNGAIPNTASGAGPHSVYFTQGGFANIAVTMEENNCIGVRDTNIAIVTNFANGGTVLGGETLCSTFDPALIQAGSNPSGGIGGTIVYQWESRQSDGVGGWTAWQDVVGQNSPSFDPAIIAATTEFRRKARRAPCSDWVVSNSVTARLVQKPNLSNDTYFTVCPGFPHADNVSDNDLNLVNPTYSLLVFPTNGTLDFEADGEFIYDPNSTFCGTDEFLYLVCNDGTGCCDTASVIVDLTDNEAPSIQNVPADLILSCDDQIPFADAVDVIENCQSVSLGMDEFTTQGVSGCAFNTYERVRIWNGVDYCSNTAAASQVISVEDKTSPDIYRIYTLPNGKKMVAGVMENVSNHWKTVSLPIQFATQPVIFTQVVTRNEPSAVNARLRNVSTTQFQVKLIEEEANDGTHAQESVAWVAFEKGALAGNAGFEVNTWLLDDALQNLAFGQTYSSAPHVFATVQTNNENDPVNVRINDLSASNIEVWLQEETSLDPETSHNLETVGYMAVQAAGNLTNLTGEKFGEVGIATLTDANMTINLTNKYHNPVVIIGAMPYGEHDQVTARVLNVTATSFEVQLEEWDYLDGVHGAETVPFMVIEGSLPLDRTVSCDNIPAPLAIGTQIIAVDNCDATIQLVMTESPHGFDCQTDTTFTRTWTTVDDCGNVTELIQTYILQDIIAPSFTVPANLTIVCGDDKDDLTLTGDVVNEMDNCSPNVQAVYTDNLSNLVNCTGYITRTWTATDQCGNSTQKVQLIYVSPTTDTDGDGVVDHFDLDDDNDGIPDLIETFADFDGDGIPNHLDLDSDNDGIPDLIEIGGRDVNGDGMVDNANQPNWDSDGDGFAYGFDGSDIDTMIFASVTMNPLSLQNDRDQDGHPNFLDRDSDNDGIPDLVEAGGVDTNGDGAIDYPGNDPLAMQDADHDGFWDTYDPDNDNLPGIESPKDPLIMFNGTFYRGGKTTDVPDFDGDKVPDFLDNDSDNDGTGDLIEAGGIDTDGDGRLELNATFVDNNNDGFHDIYVIYPLVATEGDGLIIDGRPEDIDGNGTVYTRGDVDLDGQPNHRDLESDGDNILDMYEAGLKAYDSDGNGIVDNWTDINQNGFDDELEASSNIFTEEDGLTIDGRPEDGNDADASAYRGAAPDGGFAQTNGNPDVDDDADGILNFLDRDSDNDLLPDEKEDRNFNGNQDPGETDVFNPDSDDDQIKDGIEDYNRNGIFEPGETNPLNPNTDGDPLLDGEEDENFNGIVDGLESDPRDPCDPILNDACRGLVLDIKVKLMGARIEADNSSLMRDDLRNGLWIPDSEPYSVMNNLYHIGEDHFEPYVNPNGGAGWDGTQIIGQGSFEFNGQYRESCNPGMFYVTGNDATVDWVMVELRSDISPDSVIATRAGLLQRDGDVRDIDGISYLTFSNIPSGSFYVAVRHRNHLGVMTENPYVLSPTVTHINFTDPQTPVYGDNAMATIGSEKVLWAGDLNGDGYVIYQGPQNDILKLFQYVILDEGNNQDLANYILPGYQAADFNLDGSTIYQGPSNERAKLLLHSILSSPQNSLGLANFVLIEKLP